MFVEVKGFKIFRLSSIPGSVIGVIALEDNSEKIGPGSLGRIVLSKTFQKLKMDIIKQNDTGGRPFVNYKELFFNSKDSDQYTFSLSHKNKVAAAIVVTNPKEKHLTGIDIEMKKTQEPEIQNRMLLKICPHPTEQEVIERMKPDPITLFSAKESAFKALSSTTERLNIFSDIRLHGIDDNSNVITLKSKLLSNRNISVHCFSILDYVLTITAVNIKDLRFPEKI